MRIREKPVKTRRWRGIKNPRARPRFCIDQVNEIGAPFVSYSKSRPISVRSRCDFSHCNAREDHTIVLYHLSRYSSSTRDAFFPRLFFFYVSVSSRSKHLNFSSLRLETSLTRDTRVFFLGFFFFTSSFHHAQFFIARFKEHDLTRLSKICYSPGRFRLARKHSRWTDVQE